MNECPYRIEIEQNGGKVGFEFNRFDDARDFADTCFEVCDNNTKIIIIKKEDK